MVSTSVTTLPEVFAYPIMWSLEEIPSDNYPMVLELIPFGRVLFHTAFVGASVTILELITASLAAYALARLRFSARDQLFVRSLATLMIPGEVTLMPNLLLLRPFGWFDTYLALIIPSAFTAARHVPAPALRPRHSP